jgi:putative membrane protein
MALVIFGVLLLVLGLWAHVKFMRVLRAERALLMAERYVHGEESFPYSITLLIATLLLLLGLVAIIDMAFSERSAFLIHRRRPPPPRKPPKPPVRLNP